MPAVAEPAAVNQAFDLPWDSLETWARPEIRRAL
jgi:hypothetical protein